MASEAIDSATRAHSVSLSSLNRIVTRYGLGRLPCTSASTPRLLTSSFVTWPLRAYERPRESLASSTSRSSACSQRPAHQVRPNAPRRVWARIPSALRRGPYPLQSFQSPRPLRLCLLIRRTSFRHCRFAAQTEHLAQFRRRKLSDPR